MKRALHMLGLAAIAVLTSTGSVRAQQDPYTEGPVVSVSEIRTEPGQFDNYMNYIFGDYARLQNALKEEGIILDWGVYVTETRNPDEADVILTTVYANMAALDGLDDRSDPIVERVMGLAPPQAAEAFANRGQMRTSIGSQLFRQLVPRQ